MSEEITDAEKKGWLLLKDTLKDDEAFFTIRQGMPITIRGSEGTLYIVYPSGRFYKVGAEEVESARVVDDGEFVDGDYLATIVAWIKHDEKRLEEKWGCGNISLRDPERERRLTRLRYERIARRRREHWYDNLSFGKIVPILVCFGITIASIPIMLPLIQDVTQQIAQNQTAVTPATELTTFSTVLVMLLPILMILPLGWFLIKAGMDW